MSTLFLLQQTQRESTSGRRFDRLVNSVPLWLQLLAVLLITWILIQPRYVMAKSTQRIAIILDSSASMRVFKDKIEPAITREIPRLQGHAANVELWLMESDPAKSKIYRGKSTEEMLLALENWLPGSGSIDQSNALRVARSLVGAEGAITYITDTPLADTPPYNASAIAIGQATDNCGITGVSFEQRDDKLIWKTIIRNYSETDQSRTWQLETPTGESRPKTISLPARSLTTIQGVFPTGVPRCRVVLGNDAFDLDNSIPLVRPAPKPLLIHSTLPLESKVLSDRMLASFPNLTNTPEPATADLIVTSTATTPSQTHLIVSPQDKVSSRPYLTGTIVASRHPLTEGLNWQTLLVRATLALPHTESDDILIWQGNRPLIFLRHHPTSGNKALILNFDINQSNALKQPAMAVLLLRFCEQLRIEKIAPEIRITETSQPLELTRRKGDTAQALIYTSIDLQGKELNTGKIDPSVSSLSAPDEPGFFTISQGNNTLLAASAIFADTREADFSQCASGGQSAATMATAVDRHTRDDHLWRVWACLILAAVFGAWLFTKSGSPATTPS